jgi:hypothetical protein
VVGGVAYGAGRHAANRQAQEADQDAQIAELQQQQYQQQAAPPPPPPAAAPAPAPSGGISEQGIEELKKLAELKEQGILTDAEFEVQKAKILQGG